MLCINSAILLPWVQLSVQQKYDLPKNEKYCVLGGKKSDATRKSWKLFSNPLTVRGWRGGEGCSLPVAHQSGRSTILNISGNSLDLFVNVLRFFLILTVHWGRRSAPHLWEGLDRPHCIHTPIVLSTFNQAFVCVQLCIFWWTKKVMRPKKTRSLTQTRTKPR